VSRIFISIPSGAIKRLFSVQSDETIFKFQFLLVRLKDSRGRAERVIKEQFQFLLVRLKVYLTLSTVLLN